MQTINIKSLHRRLMFCLLCVYVIAGAGCSKDVLKEVPLSTLNEDNALTSKKGFDFYITALHQAAREELSGEDLLFYFDQNTGTDVVTSGQISVTQFVNYTTYLTPFTHAATKYWNWAYTLMLPRANTIIVNANRSDLNGIWANEKEKNAVLAEARFFRAYTYNILATLYGGVPIVDTVYSSPKTDFTRAERKAVYEFAKNDLEFASQWLPETVAKGQEGRIVKAAADHLLSEVYISLGEYDKSIESASRVINSPLYKLMKTRFGVNQNKPGDVFSDLFIQGNQNRSSGNLESIYVWQFEEFTPGGGGTMGGNHLVRGWLPFLVQLQDPSGKPAIVLNDTIGRGVAIMRPTTYFLYDLWQSDWNNDMRNSKYNIRREYYYNNPASPAYFGKLIEKRTTEIDTMQRIYPTIRKVEGKAWQGSFTSGRTGKDFIVYRLAETYLLRAEAYLRNGNPEKAAEDINEVRGRANAHLIDPSEVTIDFLLDERARELIAEEPRRRTLMRMGKLVERVRKYNMKAVTRTSIQDHHELFPIPQSAIDANFSRKLDQNPDYNQ